MNIFLRKAKGKKKRKKGNGGGGWFMKYCFVLTILTKTVQFWLVFIQSDRSNYHKGETLEKWLKHKSICKPLLLLGLYISRILLTSNPRKYLLLMYLDFLFSFFQSNQVHSSRVIKWGYFFVDDGDPTAFLQFLAIFRSWYMPYVLFYDRP